MLQTKLISVMPVQNRHPSFSAASATNLDSRVRGNDGREVDFERMD